MALKIKTDKGIKNIKDEKSEILRLENQNQLLTEKVDKLEEANQKLVNDQAMLLMELAMKNII